MAHLRILPLGGLGEIGKNMTVVEYDGQHRRRRYRADVPDLRDAGDRPRAARLRLPARARRRHRGDRAHARPRGSRRGAPVRAARDRDAAGDLRRPADDRAGALEARGAQDPRRPARGDRDRGEVDAGPFGIEMVHMSHSIPDSRAVAITTALGTVLVTGDYKFDQTPVDGEPADVSRLAELGREGVLCLCGDSTNADRARDRALGVERRAGAAGGVLALRGPDHRHLLRLQRPPRPAGHRRRRRSSTARSRWSGARCARTSTSPRTSGSPRRPTGLLIQPKEIEDYPDEQVVAISTGSQGEPLSALRRMAHGDHPDVELHSGDTVIFSATPVPGQRALGQRDDRPDLPDRGVGDHRRRRADPRLGARLRRRRSS